MIPRIRQADAGGDDAPAAFPTNPQALWRRVRWRRLDHDWMVGETLNDVGQRREYIAHLMAPRFVASVVAIDLDGQPEPDEQPVRRDDGSCPIDEMNLLCEVDWIDPSRKVAARALLRLAAAQIERHYAALAAEPISVARGAGQPADGHEGT